LFHQAKKAERAHPPGMNSTLQIFRLVRHLVVCRCAALFPLVLALLVLPARGTGLANDYLLDVWTSENGLPDSSVTAIAQTPDGYLWIGTYNGLVRFDGAHFVWYDPGNQPALIHARVRQLFVDAQGTLWVNTYGGSLAAVRQGKFYGELARTNSSEADLTLVASGSNTVTFLSSRGNILQRTSGASTAIPTGTPNATPIGIPTGVSAGKAGFWREITSPRRGLDAACAADASGTLWYVGNDKHLWRVIDGEFEEMPENAGLSGQNGRPRPPMDRHGQRFHVLGWQRIPGRYAGEFRSGSGAGVSLACQQR
jgi:ligand-binding sensor domain-containing protein